MVQNDREQHITVASFFLPDCEVFNSLFHRGQDLQTHFTWIIVTEIQFIQVGHVGFQSGGQRSTANLGDATECQPESEK